MSIGTIYNNIGIESVATVFVLQRMKSIPITKALLISPIISHRELLSYLSKSNVKIQSLEKLIIEKTSFFSNFNKRFYDNLCNSINTIQFLHEIELADIADNSISIRSEIQFNKDMGNRAEKIYKASANISKILAESAEKLYLNLRIEL
jgi:hypothetical protein